MSVFNSIIYLHMKTNHMHSSFVALGNPDYKESTRCSLLLNSSNPCHFGTNAVNLWHLATIANYRQRD